MGTSPTESLHMLKKYRPAIQEGAPGVAQAFGQLHQSSLADGALSHKIKELIALALSVSARCDFCIAAHINACLDAGATREEILEACGVSIMMGGGPSYTYTAYVMECLDELESERG